MCESDIDKEACVYADQVRKIRQREYDVAHIYVGHEDDVKEMETATATRNSSSLSA